MFSSNAAPFEPNSPYSPFAVYSLLEHGGDYSAATHQLASEGFGKSSESDVNLSGFLDGLAKTGPPPAKPPAEPELPDPGPDIQEQILFLPNTVKGRDPIKESDIRPIAKTLDWKHQRRMWQAIKDSESVNPDQS